MLSSILHPAEKWCGGMTQYGVEAPDVYAERAGFQPL
jgi:hypothetical protein